MGLSAAVVAEVVAISAIQHAAIYPRIIIMVIITTVILAALSIPVFGVSAGRITAVCLPIMVKNENRDFYLSPMSASTSILGPVWVPITGLVCECMIRSAGKMPSSRLIRFEASSCAST